jgi:hypothetical protein
MMERVDSGAERSPTETPAIRAVSAPGPSAAPPVHAAERDDGEVNYRIIFILSRVNA